MPKVRWVLSYGFYSKFHTLSSSAKILKSVKIWQSQRQFKGWTLFETQCSCRDTHTHTADRRLYLDHYDSETARHTCNTGEVLRRRCWGNACRHVERQIAATWRPWARPGRRTSYRGMSGRTTRDQRSLDAERSTVAMRPSFLVLWTGCRRQPSLNPCYCPISCSLLASPSSCSSDRTDLQYILYIKFNSTWKSPKIRPAPVRQTSMTISLITSWD